MGEQEFDLATRTSDAAAQLAVLERCQALPQFLPEHFCKLAAQAEAACGGGSHSAAAKAALAAALRLMLRQAPQPYPAIAQVAAWHAFILFQWVFGARMVSEEHMLKPHPALNFRLHAVCVCCGICCTEFAGAQRTSDAMKQHGCVLGRPCGG